MIRYVIESDDEGRNPAKKGEVKGIFCCIVDGNKAESYVTGTMSTDDMISLARIARETLQTLEDGIAKAVSSDLLDQVEKRGGGCSHE